MRSLLCTALASATIALCALAASAPAAARQSTMTKPPDACETIEDTGQLITIPWASEGCHASRDAFRFAIADRTKFPGWYPPLTCVAGGVRFLWDAPSCAHARNAYASHAIRPVWFGSHVRKSRAAAPTPVPLGSGSSASPMPSSAPRT